MRIGHKGTGTRFLFDSHGRHIATLVDGQLLAPSGAAIGHLLSCGIVIAHDGRYLGEIVHESRLMSNRTSEHRSRDFGSYRYSRNGEAIVSPNNPGPIGPVEGFEDTPVSRLLQRPVKKARPGQLRHTRYGWELWKRGYRPAVYARAGLMYGIRNPMDGPVHDTLAWSIDWCSCVMADHFDRTDGGMSDAWIEPYEGWVCTFPPVNLTT